MTLLVEMFSRHRDWMDPLINRVDHLDLIFQLALLVSAVPRAVLGNLYNDMIMLVYNFALDRIHRTGDYTKRMRKIFPHYLN